MSITTKKGDKGKTSLYRGQAISKDNIRIETSGVLDELCSHIGAAKAAITDKKTKNTLELIQKDLFVIGTEIATECKFVNKLKKRIDKTFIRKIEKNIKKLEARLGAKQRCFCLPGNSPSSSFLDISRVIARKLERRVVTMIRKKVLKNCNILVYLNRLSDFFYLLARMRDKKPNKW